MENNVVINDYTQMDRILKEERQYILNIVKKIKAANCNVLLIQKSILRDAVNELALHFLSREIRTTQKSQNEYTTRHIHGRKILKTDTRGQ